MKRLITETLEPLSLGFILEHFTLKPVDYGTMCYRKDSSMIVFFNEHTGNAVVSHSGREQDSVPFATHQDAVDFIRI